MANTARQWDIGTHIQIDLGEDLTPALALRILFRKPNGATMEVVGAVGTPNTSIRYTTLAGDLDVPGTWVVQGFEQHNDGSWTTTEDKMTVEPAIRRVEVT